MGLLGFHFDSAEDMAGCCMTLYFVKTLQFIPYPEKAKELWAY